MTAVNKPPLSIKVISLLFIALGVIAFLAGVLPPAQRFGELKAHPGEIGLMLGTRIAAIVAGAFMLRGFNWARWLLVAWIAFHIGLSALHSLFEVLFHCVLFGVVLYFLFRPEASAHFRGPRAAAPQIPKPDGTPVS